MRLFIAIATNFVDDYSNKEIFKGVKELAKREVRDGMASWKIAFVDGRNLDK
ncbi:MAG: hypothetical protein QXD38_07935 [Ignisphaera sp.]